IGLLFLNYEIVLRGYKTIYLGQTMPIENLVDLEKFYDNLHFLSYFTVEPSKNQIDRYLKEFKNSVNSDGNSKLWIMGRQTQHISAKSLTNDIRIFNSIEELSNAL
ncbi:MAG: MerR family transcriptional regulator, partial [Flavobacteriaceae bacterium]